MYLFLKMYTLIFPDNYRSLSGKVGGLPSQNTAKMPVLSVILLVFKNVDNSLFTLIFKALW